jgi:hypothetical protein
LKSSFFHLMPFTGVEGVPPDWPTPNRFFDAERVDAFMVSYA